MSGSTVTNDTNEVLTETLPEPGPDWPVARRIWDWAWELHWIGFGILFGVLAIYAFIAVAFANRRKGFGSKPFFIAINLLLFGLGSTRSVYLLLDPYESRQNGIEDPKWLTLLLFGIAYPCLTSAFSLIHLAFLEVTKMQIVPSKLQNVKFLSGVIFLHFIIVFIAETSASIKPELDFLLIACQSFFIIWGLFLSGSFIYSGCRVMNSVENVQRQLIAMESNARPSLGTTSKTSTTKVAKITLGTSFLGLAVCGLQFYSMLGVYGMYSKAVHPSPWPWLAFQSSFRSVELAMAGTIAYSAMQTERGKTKISSWAERRVMSTGMIKPSLVPVELVVPNVVAAV